ncbi:NAD-dependent deacylase [Prolixibacter sp. NT017]|uniref:SIR2 family NAD-dependent protein deacylase n=1 Tax=Prolixibacter sp. NT017 TaxID=2652390 RepID=UPI00129907A9|nr:NAD-dependent deacylase [Prolixibacter sp. NT017]
MIDYLDKAARLIRESGYTVAFTGAGISVESGIPPFRGKNGLWSRYDPKVLDLDYFYSNPHDSWVKIKEIFYDFFGKAQPNPGHIALAGLEQKGWLESVITQNIDNLHQEAGSKTVWEFHGNSQWVVCPRCGARHFATEIDMSELPPRCHEDGSVLKPDFIFFGEGIPREAYDQSFAAARKAEVMLVIGTTGEVMPASMVPYEAARSGATIIEINPETTPFTNQITHIFLEGKAGEVLPELLQRVSQLIVD